MIEETNVLLEKYEIKKPDYDYVARSQTDEEQVACETQRYILQDDMWTQSASKIKNHATIMFTGDIACTEEQINEATLDDGFDFSYQVAQLKPVFKNADLVVGNLETMLVPEAPYSTEKYVSEQASYQNAPPVFLDALKKTGFDMLTNANNHNLDTGAVGIGVTIDNLQKKGFIHTGIFKEDKPHFELIDVVGFKVAIVAFATNYNNKEENLTEEGVSFLLNSYSESNAENILSQARQAGAEVVFACIHWGSINALKRDLHQKNIARTLANIGYDCIIGSHPHALQRFVRIPSAHRRVPVFYSMGNLISNHTSGPKSRSMIACIRLERSKDGVSIRCSYIPVYTSERFGPKKYVALPVPIDVKDEHNKWVKGQIRQAVGKLMRNQIFYFQERIEAAAAIAEEPNEVVEAQKPPKLSQVLQFPICYDNGKYVFDIYRTNAVIAQFSETADMISYILPCRVAGVQITELKEGAFKNNVFVKELVFNKNILNIPAGLCENCVNLEGFRLGRNVMEIQARSFAGCTRLSSVVLRKKLKTIGSKAFAGCVNLRSVKIPSNVTEIANDAFDGCSRITFYCPAGSYAEQYAAAHGYAVVNMELG